MFPSFKKKKASETTYLHIRWEKLSVCKCKCCKAFFPRQANTQLLNSNIVRWKTTQMSAERQSGDRKSVKHMQTKTDFNEKILEKHPVTESDDN